MLNVTYCSVFCNKISRKKRRDGGAEVVRQNQASLIIHIIFNCKNEDLKSHVLLLD